MRQGFGATVEDTSRAIRNDAVHRAVELTRQGWPRLGLLLLAALGQVSTTGPSESTVYSHAFSVLQSAQHPSLTLFLDDENQDYRYALGVLTGLDINVLLGAFATFVVFAWRDEDEYIIPAATVAEIHRANRSARRDALANLRPVQ